ncbi:hypothetical protein AB4Z52_22875 [Rhizobium sp. 2YAF20]
MAKGLGNKLSRAANLIQLQRATFRRELLVYSGCLLMFWAIGAASLSGFILTALFLLVAIAQLCKAAATKITTGMRKHSMLTRYVGALVSICFFFLLTGRACYIAAILVDVEFRPDNLQIIAGF